MAPMAPQAYSSEGGYAPSDFPGQRSEAPPGDPGRPRQSATLAARSAGRGSLAFVGALDFGEHVAGQAGDVGEGPLQGFSGISPLALEPVDFGLELGHLPVQIIHLAGQARRLPLGQLRPLAEPLALGEKLREHLVEDVLAVAGPFVDASARVCERRNTLPGFEVAKSTRPDRPSNAVSDPSHSLPTKTRCEAVSAAIPWGFFPTGTLKRSVRPRVSKAATMALPSFGA